MNLIDTLRTEIINLLSSFISSEAIVNLLTVVTMVLFWLILGSLVTRLVRLLILRTKSFEDKQTKQGLTMRKLVNNLIKSVFFLWSTLR